VEDDNNGYESNADGEHLEEVKVQDEDHYEGSQYDPDGDQDQTEDEDRPSNDGDEPYQRALRILNEDSDSEVEDIVYLRAARAVAAKNVREENPSRSAMRRKEERPKRSKRKESCLAAWISIAGTDAFTLFDTGSTMDSVSPDFARVNDLRCFPLEKQVQLQLGCVGSRGSINYGVKPAIKVLGSTPAPYYFDVVNIDRYDCIVGTPFMRKFGIEIDFRTDTISVMGKNLPVLLPEEEVSILKGRKQFKRPQDP
jgi:hypothetical protein